LNFAWIAKVVRVMKYCVFKNIPRLSKLSSIHYNNFDLPLIFLKKQKGG